MNSILTVTTPAADTRLTTLAAVKLELDITGDDSDPKLEAHIVAASAAVQTHCKRIFAIESVVESIRLRRHHEEIILKRIPVVAVASVAVASVALEATDYEADRDAGMLYRLSGDLRTSWPCAVAVVVEYSTGFATIPADVVKATTMLVAGYRAGAGRDPTLRSETIDGVRSVGYALAGAVGGMEGSLPGTVATLLEKYVMRTLP